VTLATAGGASITIAGGNITVQCPGTITVHASNKSFTGPTSLSREMNSWPTAKFNDYFVVLDHENNPVPGQAYEITRADGAIIRGVTDANGRTTLQQGLSIEGIRVRILGEAPK